MIKKFLAVLLLAAILGTMFAGAAWAEKYPFHPDDSVSPARNKVAKYAHDILNYEWTTNKTILGYRGTDNKGKLITPYYRTGTIRGIPYTDFSTCSFKDYQNLDITDKEKQGSSYKMQFGMVCATFVTDCIRQAFPFNEKGNPKLPMDDQCLFHKRYTSHNNYWRYRNNEENYGSIENWNGKIDSISDNVFLTNHSESQWLSIWTSVKLAQENSDPSYPAYRKLQRGDYLDNYTHCILVIDNDRDAGTIKYIDQTTCWDSNTVVGTHIGEYDYSKLSEKNYVPMYVKYPDDTPAIPSDWIKIDDENNFEDAAFRQSLIEKEKCDDWRQYGFDGNGYFSDEEISAVSKLYIENAGITNLDGIEIFYNLEELHCNNNSIKNLNLDLSKLPNLKIIGCSNSGLESLNLANAQNLQELYCSDNQLSGTLNMGVFRNLQKFDCSNNAINSLQLTGCDSLTDLDCSHNQLTQLTVRSTLKKLNASDNKISALNPSNSTVLEELDCQSNQITKLDLSACKNLKILSCSFNYNLDTLNIENCTALQKLSCSENNLSALDVSNCSSLQEIHCGRNHLPYVDISTRVSSATLTGQRLSGWIGSIAADKSKYSVDFSKYIPSAKLGNVSNVKGYNSSGSEISTSYQNGVATFTAKPEKITYSYQAGSYNNSNRLGMTATVNNLTFSMPSLNDPSILTESPLPDGVVGESYSATIAMWGNAIGVALSDNSSLPKGLSLSMATETPGNLYLYTCQITGIPEEAGEYTFTILLQKIGLNVKFKTFTIKVHDKPTITTASPLNAATVGRYYSTSFAVTGTPPITLSKARGTLPDGLSFYPSTKTLSGTPTKSGEFEFYMQAEDNVGASEKYFRLIVNPKPSISTTSLPDATSGTYYNYSQHLSASGGTPSLTWRKDTSSTASWLNVISDGVIYGTPPTVTSAAAQNLTVIVKDKNGASAIKTFSITVNPKPSISTNATLPEATSGTYYIQQLSATGGTKPLTWSMTDDSSASWLNVSSSGYIYGTPPTVTSATTQTVTVQVEDKNGAPATKTLYITIKAAATKPTILTTSLPAGTTGTAYSKTLSASGTTPITWTASGLPAGLTCSSGGVISGTPNTAWSGSVTIKATNSAGTTPKALPLTINAAATKPTILTTSLPAGTTGTAYSKTLSASGTTPITWTASGLPAGLTCSSRGVISGTPNTAWSGSVTIKATNSAGTTPKALPLTINAAATKPTILTTSLPAGTTGTAYSTTLSASGTTPMTWTASGLPAGLTCSSGGVISGTPKTAWSGSVTIKATNSAGTSTPKTLPLTINAAATKPTILTTSLPAGTTGTAYNKTLSASGTAPTTWSKTGGTASWASVSSAGKITGKPTKAGTFTLVVRAKNSAGSATKTLKITVKDVKPVIKTTSLANATVGTNYNKTLSASGNNITWSKTSGTATWAKISSTGKITGKPTKAGTFTLVVRAKNSAGSVTKTLKITVKDVKPVIKTTSLANATVGQNYNKPLSASGSNITWSKTSGTATWAKVSSAGKITGKPTKAGTFTLVVRAKNSAGSASKTLKIKVVSVSTASTASDRGEAEKFKDYEEFEDYVDDEPEDEIENKGSEYNAVLSLVSSDDVKFIFSLGSWTDVNGKALQVKSEDLTVYINYEPNENIKVNDENIFEILSKDINFEAGSAVYVEAAAGSEDALTSNIVDLGSASANNDSGKQGGSSGCSSGVYSLALLLALAALRKFKK